MLRRWEVRYKDTGDSLLHGAPEGNNGYDALVVGALSYKRAHDSTRMLLRFNPSRDSTSAA